MRKPSHSIAILLAGLLISSCAHLPTVATPKLAKLNEQITANSKDAAAYSNRGYTLALLGRKMAARADLRRAVELDGGAPMHNRVGWAYFNMGDAKDALREWKLAADLSQHKARYDYYCLALGYWANGDLAKALENYNLAVERDERFGEWKTLVERVGEWTETEQREMKAIYSIWSKTWPLPKN